MLSIMGWIAIAFAATAALLVLRLAEGRRSRQRDLELAAERGNDTEESFLVDIAAVLPGADEGRQRRLATTVYSYLQGSKSRSSRGAFPVRADDQLAEVYGMAPEDVVDCVEDLLERCGRELPRGTVLHRLPPLDKVSDLVAFLTACPPARPSTGSYVIPASLWRRISYQTPDGI